MHGRRYENLPELLEDAVRHAPNGIPAERLALAVGKSCQVLVNESNPDCGSHKLGVEMVEPIMLHAGAGAMVAEHLSRVAGGVYVDLAKVRDLPHRPAGAVMDLSLECMADYGRVAQETRAALANGQITAGELKRITHAIWECMQSLASLDLAAKNAAGVTP